MRNSRALGIDTGTSTTYIMPIVIGNRERMYRLGHELRRGGSVGCAGRLSGGAAKIGFVSALASRRNIPEPISTKR